MIATRKYVRRGDQQRIDRLSARIVAAVWEALDGVPEIADLDVGVIAAEVAQAFTARVGDRLAVEEVIPAPVCDDASYPV